MSKHPNEISIDEVGDMQKLSNDEMAGSIVNWHINACNQVNHALNARYGVIDPDNHSIEVEICIGEDENGVKQFRLLLPEEEAAFKAGIQYMFDTFDTLPFKYVLTDADGKPCGTSESSDSIHPSETGDTQ